MTSPLMRRSAMTSGLICSFAICRSSAQRRNWSSLSGWLAPIHIGYRAAAAALSDLAAMGATPLGMLVALAIPDRWRADAPALADGLREIAVATGTPIVGGNTTDADELSITTTVLGAAYDVLRRDAASPGDLLYVTGRLGGPGAAVRALKTGRSAEEFALRRFTQPMPRLREARWLIQQGATAAIDISDGLVADARHLAMASGVHLDIALDRLPCLEGIEPLDAAASGEEYELIVAAPIELDRLAFERRFGIPLTCIGRAEAGTGSVTLTRGGAPVAAPGGHDHLSPA
jgi:thiamine-monophosphate kinase